MARTRANIFGASRAALARRWSITAIRWGTGKVLDATIRRLENAGIRYALGPAWYDVDRWSDVMLLAAHLRLLRKEHRSSASPCPTTEAVLKRLGVLHD